MNRVLLLHVVALSLLLLPMGSCKRQDDFGDAEFGSEPESSPRYPRPAAPDDTTAMRNAGPLSEVLGLWNEADEAAATARFVTIDWGDAAAMAGYPVLQISEEDYASLSTDDQMNASDDAMALVAALRELVVGVRAAGDEAMTASNMSLAEQHYRAILALGEALSMPGRLELIQMVGKATTEMAEDRLSALELAKSDPMANADPDLINDANLP